MGSDSPLSDALADIKRQLDPRVRALLDDLSLEAEALVRGDIAEGGSHDRNTKTPASPGRGPASITGQLAGAVIRKKARSTGKSSWRADVGVAKTGRGDSRYSNANVARFVNGGHRIAHRGTGRLSKKSGSSTGSVPAYPFMVRPLKTVAARAVETARKHLSRWP